MTGTRLEKIKTALGDRDLVWFGTRGVDVEPLVSLARPKLVVSQIAPLIGPLAENVEQDCLELRTGSRVDLDRYDIDYDVSAKTRGLKAQFLARIGGASVVTAYRPAEFLSASNFCEQDVTNAFNFHLMQRQFEHKPWVQRLLGRFDPNLALLPTHFLKDTDVEQVRRLLEKGPLVGRTSSSTGGAGVFLIETESDFLERTPPHRDGFIGLTPFYAGATPLNVNACVYASGGIAVFGVSFQLIGVSGLTARRFGFCGNDFAAAGELSRAELDLIEDITLTVGNCLSRAGYRGVFGLDLLRKTSGDYLVVELNARFQASTSLGSKINQALGFPDPFTEHIAAFLDMPPPSGLRCGDQTLAIGNLVGQAPVAQVFHRNLLVDTVHLDLAPAPLDGSTIDTIAPPAVSVMGGALLFRSLHNRRITNDGYAVVPHVSALGHALRIGF